MMLCPRNTAAVKVNISQSQRLWAREVSARRQEKHEPLNRKVSACKSAGDSEVHAECTTDWSLDSLSVRSSSGNIPNVICPARLKMKMVGDQKVPQTVSLGNSRSLMSAGQGACLRGMRVGCTIPGFDFLKMGRLNRRVGGENSRTGSPRNWGGCEVGGPATPGACPR